MKNKIKQIVIAALALSIYSCDYSDEAIVTPKNSGPTINNNLGEINSRLKIVNEEISISNSNTSGRVNSDIKLTLVSEISPPTIDGHTLMANQLDVKGQVVAVSYNYKGDPFYGGVDLINIHKDELLLISQINYVDSDVSIAHFDGSWLYIGGASSSSDSTAFVDIIKVKNDQPVYEDYKRVRLGGHTTTGIYETFNTVYVTTGNTSLNGGGMHILKAGNLDYLHYQPFEDARWVAHDDQKNPMIMTSSSLSVLERKDNTYEIKNEFSYTANYATESKSTADIAGDLIYVAAGYDGVLILDAKNGSILNTIELPAGSSSEAHVNSVVAWGNTIAFSTGEGVYLAKHDAKNTSKAAPELIGRLELGDYQSINHVARVGKFLAIAAGTGGTKYIKMN